MHKALCKPPQATWLVPLNITPATDRPTQPTRQRRRHNVKPPVLLQDREHLVKLEEAARPPVQQQQRQRARAARLDVHKVDVDAVDAGLELGAHRVELGLPGAPVVGGAPVIQQLLVGLLGRSCVRLFYVWCRWTGACGACWRHSAVADNSRAGGGARAARKHRTGSARCQQPTLLSRSPTFR
jgi:hypothetical protein